MYDEDCFASPLCYFEAFFSATLLAFVACADLTLSFNLLYSGKRKQREENKKEATPHVSCF